MLRRHSMISLGVPCVLVYFLGLAYGQASITLTPTTNVAAVGLTPIRFRTSSLAGLTSGTVYSYTIDYDDSNGPSLCALLGIASADGTVAGVSALPSTSVTYAAEAASKTATIRVYAHVSCAVGGVASGASGAVVAIGTTSVTVGHTVCCISQ